MCNYGEKDSSRESIAKPWGIQYPILRRPAINVDEISVVAGGYCSVHRHVHKANLFHVLEGSLAIISFAQNGAVIRAGSLVAGESCMIPEGERHQFWSQGGCLAQEVYLGVEDHLLVCPNDIERNPEFAVGGISLSLATVPSMAGVYLSEAGS